MQRVIERVINLLIYLLESPRPVSADEVRRTVQGYEDQSDDAFHRMFERDKDVLRKLGAPIKMVATDVWEVEYGYQVDPDEYALRDLKLSQQERGALSLASRMVRLEGSHLGLDALLKLGGMDRSGGLEPVGADLGAGADVLADLFVAVSERREITFTYRDALRKVQPYGIAHRRGHWYLVGDTSEGERRYRVDRLDDLNLVGEPDSFRKPRGFDIRKAVDQQPWEAGSDDQVDATVHFDPEVAWWAARTLGVDEPDNGDGLTASVPISNIDAFIGWVLNFGDQFEVLDPPELRQEVGERVEGALRSLT